MSELTNHYDLWTRLLGNPPEPDQFIYWTAHFDDEIIRYGIQQTASKNLKLDGKMTLRHRENYAVKVMRNRVEELRQVAAMKAKYQPTGTAQNQAVPSTSEVNTPAEGQTNQKDGTREC